VADVPSELSLTPPRETKKLKKLKKHGLQELDTNTSAISTKLADVNQAMLLSNNPCTNVGILVSYRSGRMIFWFYCFISEKLK
jgi:hypothetical protein